MSDGIDERMNPFLNVPAVTPVAPDDSHWWKELRHHYLQEAPARDSGPLSEFTYIVECDGYVKIGSTKDVAKRIETLQAGSPKKLTVWAVFRGGRKLEKLLHDRFAKQRTHREWFKFTGTLRDFCRKAKSCTNYGPDPRVSPVTEAFEGN